MRTRLPSPATYPQASENLDDPKRSLHYRKARLHVAGAAGAVLATVGLTIAIHGSTQTEGPTRIASPSVLKAEAHAKKLAERNAQIDAFEQVQIKAGALEDSSVAGLETSPMMNVTATPQEAALGVEAIADDVTIASSTKQPLMDAQTITQNAMLDFLSAQHPYVHTGDVFQIPVQALSPYVAIKLDQEPHPFQQPGSPAGS